MLWIEFGDEVLEQRHREILHWQVTPSGCSRRQRLALDPIEKRRWSREVDIERRSSDLPWIRRREIKKPGALIHLHDGNFASDVPEQLGIGPVFGRRDPGGAVVVRGREDL